MGLQLRIVSPSFGKKIRVKVSPPWQLAPFNKPNCMLVDATGTGTTATAFIYTDKTSHCCTQ